MRIHSETNSPPSSNETSSAAILIRQRLTLCMAVCLTWLVAATHPLWIPGLSLDPLAGFPRVPLIRLAGGLSPVLDYAAITLGLLAAWLAASTRHDNVLRWAGGTFLVAAGGLILLDQHRLQPWFYQFAILYGFAALFRADSFVRTSRWLLISIYIFSAISKFDYAFAHTMGSQMVDTLLSPFAATNALSATAKPLLAGSLPLLELGVGMGLAFKSSRLLAACLGIGLHCALIAILSPAGMNHAWGVLIWNAQFIALLYILYIGPRTETIGRSSPGSVWSRVGWVVLLLPVLEPLSLLDHWPAWQLYAPRNSRIQLRVVGLQEDALKAMPIAVQPFVHNDSAGLYAYVDLDGWSLQATRTPNYPQDRFQLGVAIAFCERFALGSAAQVTMESTSDRFTGKRSRQVFRGLSEIKAAAARFRLNALPLESLSQPATNFGK